MTPKEKEAIDSAIAVCRLQGELSFLVETVRAEIPPELQPLSSTAQAYLEAQVTAIRKVALEQMAQKDFLSNYNRLKKGKSNASK